MIILANINLVIKKENSKKCLIRVSDTGNSKIIFILLTKVVVFYLGFSIVKVGESGFEQIFLRV